MKKCKLCLEVKPVSEFYKQKGPKDGLQYYCKTCKAGKQAERVRSKDGLMLQIYTSQKASSKHRGHNQPAYTSYELSQWLLSLPAFHSLYDAWRKSGYSKGLKPSVDRIDESKGYSFDNIQLVTWQANFKNSLDHKERYSRPKQKAVKMLGLDGSLIKTFKSMMDAERETGVNSGSISMCCNRKTRTGGGYKWEFCSYV